MYRFFLTWLIVFSIAAGLAINHIDRKIDHIAGGGKVVAKNHKGELR